MTDERMISQTPTVHKLDEVSSRCLADNTKYVRESHWIRVIEEEWMWSLMLAGPSCCKEAKRENMCSVMLPGLSCCKPVGKREEEDKIGLSGSKGLRGRGWKNVTSPFYSCPRKWPGQNGKKYSHCSKIWVRTKTVKIFLRQTIIWNSFCYTLHHITVYKQMMMVKCSPTARETCVQSQVESYQRLKNGTWCHLA